MEVLELFPRYVIKGNLAKTLLSSLQVLAKEVLKAPDRSPNASPLYQQRSPLVSKKPPGGATDEQ